MALGFAVLGATAGCRQQLRAEGRRPQRALGLRARNVRADIRACATEAPETPSEAPPAPAVLLKRAEIGKKGKLQKTTTLGALGLEKLGPEATPVNVTLVVKRVRSDYYVRGTVRSKVWCNCDRCGNEYEHKAKSAVEIWLATHADGEPRLTGEDDTRADEAVERFTDDVAAIDLAPHITDGVVIGLPLKKLCSSSCRGNIPEGSLPEGWSVQFLPTEEEDNEDGDEEALEGAAEDDFEDMDSGLAEMRKKLGVAPDPSDTEPLEYKLDPDTVAMLRQLERDLRAKERKSKS